MAIVGEAGEQVKHAVPDFSQPGSDGELPSGFKEWQRGVTYTARPEILAPLRCGHEYRMIYAVRRMIGKDIEFTAYGDLYQKAIKIAKARIAEFTCPEGSESLHTWIQCHGWICKDIGSHHLLFASLTIGLVCPGTGDVKPEGLKPPSPTELMAPGGSTPEEMQRINSQRREEIYVDFDQRDLSCANPDIVMFSYGEYVPASEGIDFEPLLQRAGNRAKFHYDLLESEPGSEKQPFEILRREWFCITDPDMAIIHIFFQV